MILFYFDQLCSCFIIIILLQVPDGQKYEKDYLVGLIQSYIKPLEFIPVGVSTTSVINSNYVYNKCFNPA